MVRTCGPKEVETGCLTDDTNPNTAYCYCNDRNLCNTIIMSNATDYSKNYVSYTEKSASDNEVTVTTSDSEYSENNESAASQTVLLRIIFLYRILLYIIPINIFL